MKKSLNYFIILSLIAAACSPLHAPTNKTAKGAFQKLLACIDTQDRTCLYRNLNRQTRWSIQTVFKELVTIRKLAKKYYPQNRHKDAFGIWLDKKDAKNPGELFDLYCKEKTCLKKIAVKYSAVKNITKTNETQVTVDTFRGGSYLMKKEDKDWGLAIFEDEWKKYKLRIIDRTRQVKIDAVEFKQQKIATGEK